MAHLPDVIAIVAAGLVMLALGLLVGHSRSAKLRDGFKTALDRGEADYQRVVRALDRMKTETKNLSSFMICMPEFARQVNANLERSKIGPMIVGTLDQMFSPRQIVLFYADEKPGGELALAESRGVALTGRGPIKIRSGAGRIGWVAEHMISMDLDEFEAHARANKWTTIDPDPAGMKLDLYAPLFHGDTLFGVVAIGGLPVRHPDEKKMLKMIADLSSAALLNARLFEETQARADHDGLTGVLNKRAFERRLSIEVHRCETERAPISVFILDVDHFKHYNDTNGHQAGDEVLRAVGKILKSTVRSADIVARYGGEEFILAMPDTDATGAMEVAQKVRIAIEAYPFLNQERQPLGNLTISGGVAVFPTDGRSANDLISHADQGLYMAKAQGRNRVKHKEAQGLGDMRSLGDMQEEPSVPRPRT